LRSLNARGLFLRCRVTVKHLPAPESACFSPSVIQHMNPRNSRRAIPAAPSSSGCGNLVLVYSPAPRGAKPFASVNWSLCARVPGEPWPAGLHKEPLQSTGWFHDGAAALRPKRGAGQEEERGSLTPVAAASPSTSRVAWITIACASSFPSPIPRKG